MHVHHSSRFVANHAAASGRAGASELHMQSQLGGNRVPNRSRAHQVASGGAEAPPQLRVCKCTHHQPFCDHAHGRLGARMTGGA